MSPQRRMSPCPASDPIDTGSRAILAAGWRLSPGVLGVMITAGKDGVPE